MSFQLSIFLLIFPSITSCQYEQANVKSVTSVALSASVDRQQDSVNTPQLAVNTVFQSADGGQTWQELGTGLPKEVGIEGVYSFENEVYLGTLSGLYHRSSTAASADWEKMPYLQGRITDVFLGQTGLYACSYYKGLFQNIPGTDIWKNLSLTLKDNSIRTMLETKDGTLFVGCDSGIFKSADGGQTWKHVFDNGIVLDIVSSGDVLIGGGAEGVLRSTDGGEHWDWALNENILAKKTGLLQDRLVTILGTRDPFKVNPAGITNRLRTSDDGGKTWYRMDQSLLPVQGACQMDTQLSQVLDVYDILQAGTNIFCSFNTGIYRSADKGKTWKMVLPSNGKASFNMAVSGKVIYAATGAGGC